MRRSKSPISSRPERLSVNPHMVDHQTIAAWARIVDAIVRGDRPKRPLVRVGPTPALLQGLGLAPADLVMATGKIALARREHPEVQITTWHQLPRLLEKPLAVIPSEKRDGTQVVVLVVIDLNCDSILVPIQPGRDAGPNVILSVYGKEAGLAWVGRELVRAAQDNLPHYQGKGFAAALPQPGSASAIPSSPGPIPADGTTKPQRDILSIGKKST